MLTFLRYIVSRLQVNGDIGGGKFFDFLDQAYVESLDGLYESQPRLRWLLC